LLINWLSAAAIAIASGDVFSAVPAHPLASGNKPILAEIPHRGLLLCILLVNRQRLASRFWRPAFVIARSGGDEAIKLWSNFWIASLRAQ
jgi:hypothetical protein